MKLRWTDEEFEYLKQNHTQQTPEEIAEHLQCSSSRVRAKMVKSKLQTKNCYDNEQKNNKILEMIKSGIDSPTIQKELNVCSERVFRISHHLIVQEKEKIKKPEPIIQHVELYMLRKMKLTNFKPENEEHDERFRYRDLSPSEKLMYHGLTI